MAVNENLGQSAVSGAAYPPVVMVTGDSDDGDGEKKKLKKK